MTPSYSHAALTAMIISEINKGRQYRAFSELTLFIRGTDYIPDISVYAWRKVDYVHGDTIRMEEMPLLAIEILSPTQKALELYEKAHNTYLPAGIRSVWIVQPLAHTISVLTAQGVTLYHEGVLQDITGIELDLRVVFDE